MNGRYWSWFFATNIIDIDISHFARNCSWILGLEPLLNTISSKGNRVWYVVSTSDISCWRMLKVEPILLVSSSSLAQYRQWLYLIVTSFMKFGLFKGYFHGFWLLWNVALFVHIVTCLLDIDQLILSKLNNTSTWGSFWSFYFDIFTFVSESWNINSTKLFKSVRRRLIFSLWPLLHK